MFKRKNHDDDVGEGYIMIMRIFVERRDRKIVLSSSAVHIYVIL